MIVGTAGHIDHGKTSLIKRLTGRNTDRLPEEIKRGISIELGYAYVPLPDGGVLGFVDVPGHEKFVHTMVAGATGIDFALLVIAADDGVMPQTDEHLDILELLGVRAGAIVINKIDVVDAARIEAVRAQIADRVRRTSAADWPVFSLSAHTGEGVQALQAHLLERTRAHAGGYVLQRSFFHSARGGSGRPCARKALRKCILATFESFSAPCRLTKSLADSSTAPEAPFGSLMPNCFSNAASRDTNSCRARIEAAATARSASALWR